MAITSTSMASPLKFVSAIFLLWAILLPALEGQPAGPKKGKPRFKPGPWRPANATYYDGSSTSFGSACGYKDTVQLGYGLDTAAVSSTLFGEGKGCGACYEVRCVNSPQWCKPGSVVISATNSCPAGDPRCSPPHEHLDLAKQSFEKIAQCQGGVIPIEHRRIPCKKQGGIKFTINGNPHYNEVTITNVGGSGDVEKLEVKGDQKLPWTPLTRSWGQVWKTEAKLVEESLAFRVYTTDGRYSTSWHITPRNWQFGQTYEGKNFR